jgi:hypothetical protein
MSHFSVIVIGPNVEAQLAPYHEFECTGVVDQYVKDIDVTAEYRAKFNDSTETRLRGPDGALHSFFDERGAWRPEFSQPDTGQVFSLPSDRKEFIPEGFEKIKVPSSQVLSFAEWCEGWGGQKALQFGEQPDRDGAHKFGHVEVDGAGDVVKVIDRTNPSKKWDWYSIGGRWTGWLLLKPGAKGEVGRPGLMTPDAKPGTADVLRKGDIDFETMRDEAGLKAGATWDRCRAIVGDLSWESWESVGERHKGDWQAARYFYNSQPAIVALKTSKDDAFSWEIDPDLAGPRQAFVQAARDRACVPFAVVHKGEWSEKGRMGWFGCTSGEMDQSTWNRLVNELFDGLPDDTQMTVVDCHI